MKTPTSAFLFKKKSGGIDFLTSSTKLRFFLLTSAKTCYLKEPHYVMKFPKFWKCFNNVFFRSESRQKGMSRYTCSTKNNSDGTIDKRRDWQT